MAIELGKAISLFNEVLNGNPDYNSLDRNIQNFVRYRAIRNIFIGRFDQYTPKGIAGYLVKYNEEFEPPIPSELLQLNFNLARDVGEFISVVKSIESEFDKIIAHAHPKPQPPQQTQSKREPASEEEYNQRARTNQKSGAKPLPGAQPESPMEDYFGDWD